MLCDRDYSEIRRKVGAVVLYTQDTFGGTIESDLTPAPVRDREGSLFVSVIILLVLMSMIILVLLMSVIILLVLMSVIILLVLMSVIILLVLMSVIILVSSS